MRIDILYSPLCPGAATLKRQLGELCKAFNAKLYTHNIRYLQKIQLSSLPLDVRTKARTILRGTHIYNLKTLIWVNDILATAFPANLNRVSFIMEKERKEEKKKGKKYE